MATPRVTTISGCQKMRLKYLLLNQSKRVTFICPCHLIILGELCSFSIYFLWHLVAFILVIITICFSRSYHNGGCVGRNELGVTTQTSVEDCASACDAELGCVSFEYKKGSTTSCQLSDSCDHYSMKANDPTSDYTWYLNIPDGYTTHTMQGGNSYMWIINVLAPSNMPSAAYSTSPSASPSVMNGGGDKESATYYMG